MQGKKSGDDEGRWNNELQGTEYPTELSEPTGLEDRVQKPTPPATLFGKIIRLVSGAPEEEHDRGRTLRRAVRAQDHSAVRHMIAQGVGVNEQQESSLACIACRRADMDMLKILVKAGVDVNKPDRRSQTSRARTPLQEAARKGWLKGVEFLLSLGAEIDVCEASDVTALHQACRLGFPDIAALLLSRGADPNGSKASATSPLHETASPVIFKMLLAGGASPSLRDRNKCTPLHIHAYHGRFENVRILSEFPGLDFHALDRKGRPPVFLLGSRGDSIKTYEVFKDKGINLSLRDQGENNLAHAIANRAQSEDLVMTVYATAPELWKTKNMSGQTAVDVLGIRGFIKPAARIKAMQDRDAIMRP